MIAGALGRKLLLVVGPAALAALSYGCVDTAVSLGPSGPSTGVPGQTGRALVGRWLRVVSESEDLGRGLIVSTTWEFSEGGSARRIIVTRTVAGQIIDTSEARAEWSAGVGLLRLRFSEPILRTLHVAYAIEYRVDGTFLLLDGMRHLRVGLD